MKKRMTKVAAIAMAAALAAGMLAGCGGSGSSGGGQSAGTQAGGSGDSGKACLLYTSYGMGHAIPASKLAALSHCGGGAVPAGRHF